MLDLEKYSFKKYSKNYPILFCREKNKLKKLLPFARIEHVGSTAIKGMGGKGIIDIVIGVFKKELKNSIKILETNNYACSLKSKKSKRIFFQKIIKYNKKQRKVHLHLVLINGEEWESLILVRNYLRKNKNVQKEYSKLKKDAVKFASGDGKKYRAYKNAFLKKIKKISLKEN